MTDEERSELRVRLELLGLVRDLSNGQRDQETWKPLWEMAWKDAVEHANGLLLRYSKA